MRTRNKLAAIGGAVALLVTGAGVASASIPSSSGVFYGCVKGPGSSQPGELIVKDDGGTGSITCGSDATEIQWNQTGPQGVAGPQGPTGPAGPQATAQDVTSQVTYNAVSTGGTPTPVTLNCPSGTLALNGGVTQVDQTVDPGATLNQAGTAVLAFGQENPTGSQSLSFPRLVNSGASWRMLVYLDGAIEIMSGSQITLPITVTYYVICE